MPLVFWSSTLLNSYCLWKWWHHSLAINSVDGLSTFLTTTHFSVQFSSVAQSCSTLCNPMDCRMPGLPVHCQLLEFTQTHVHWVGDAIQPSHPLSSLSPPALNLSQHQGLFQRVSSSNQVANILELQHHSFQLSVQGWFPLGLTGWISLQSKSLLQHHTELVS